MLVLSHRGYHPAAPENTLQAFDLARRLGVDGIETDLRLSRDGQIVLFHDRLVPDGREISALTRAEICSAVGYAVPTLDEALDSFDNLVWNLEIKVPEVLDGAIAGVKRLGNTGRRFLITSFWHNAVVQFRDRAAQDRELAHCPRLQFGLLTADRPLSLSSLLGISDPPQPDPFHAIVWYYEIVDPALLAEARRRGIANFVYGVKTPDDHDRCRQLGLDGVITDHPEMIGRGEE